MTKRCSKCGDPKLLDEFAWRDKKKGRRSSECKVCHTEYRQAHYRKNREKTLKAVALRKRELRAKIHAYLAEHPCVDCTETDPVVLDFDHVSGTKLMEVSRMAGFGYSWHRILNEIAKCEVRCSNCHRRRHHLARIT